MTGRPTGQQYFEDLYRTDPDPWGLDGEPYEHRKRALSVASLPRERYRRGFEPACAAGRLTALLAGRCDALAASDPVGTALERVRRRALTGVEVRRGSLPHDWPDGELDLVVLSEILYFLDVASRAEVARRTLASLASDGHVLAVHWRHDFAEAASPADDAHADLHAVGLVPLVEHVERDFRLEVLGRA